MWREAHPLNRRRPAVWQLVESGLDVLIVHTKDAARCGAAFC
jgi:hypothetical protein